MCNFVTICHSTKRTDKTEQILALKIVNTNLTRIITATVLITSYVFRGSWAELSYLMDEKYSVLFLSPPFYVFFQQLVVFFCKYTHRE